MKKNSLIRKILTACTSIVLGFSIINTNIKTKNVLATDDSITKELVFNLSSNPDTWPTANSTTLTNYTYTLDNTDYTFGLKNVKCNNGYLMLTATAVLGLPAIEGYKLTKVVASNSGGCSKTVYVGISSSSSSESYITGGSKVMWSTTSSSYTYNLTETTANTVYYLYVTSKNAQVTSLELTYKLADSTVTVVTNEIPEDANCYMKITSVKKLVTGKYLIICEDQNICFTNAIDAAGTVNSITIFNNKILYTNTLSSYEFTISITDAGKYTIKGNNNNYIGQTTDTNGLKVDKVYTNNISFDSAGNAVIIASGGAYLRCNVNSATIDNLKQWFRYYKSDTYTRQKAIQLYKLVEPSERIATDSAELWCSNLYSNICDENGIKLPNIDWNMLETDYKNLSDDAKRCILNTESITIEDAVLRYDYIVGKYGYNDFLNRDPAPIGRSIKLNSVFQSFENIDNTDTVLISLISIGVIAIYSYAVFVSKKKKQ